MFTPQCFLLSVSTLCQLPATVVLPVPKHVCPTGVKFDDSTCFLYGGSSSVGNTGAAYNYCNSNNMIFASIRSQAEQDFVAGKNRNVTRSQTEQDFVADINQSVIPLLEF